MNLKYFDRILLVLMSFTAIVCINQLYFQKTKSDKNTKSLGLITELSNVVKIKKNIVSSWDDVNSGEELSLNDELYTHDKSLAQVAFKNGNKIWLSENSLIKITEENQTTKLEINKGQLTADLNENNKNFKLKINGKELEIAPSNSKIQIDENEGKNSITVISGNLKIKDGDEIREIHQNQVLTKDLKNGTFQLGQINSTPLLPKNHETFYTANQKLVAFKWNLSKNTQSTFLISKNRSFREPIYSIDLLDKSNLDIELVPGRYYWKIKNPNFADSATYALTIEKEEPPQIMANRHIVFFKNKKVEEVKLNWDKTGFSQFKLRVRKYNNENSEEFIKKNYYNLNLTQTGKYYISVLGIDQKRPEAIWSDEYEINYKEVDHLQIERIGPEIIYRVNYQNKVIKEKIYFKSEIDNLSYKIKLKSPDNISKEILSDQPFIEIPLDKPGRYTWEATASLNDKLSNTLQGEVNFKRPLKIKQSPKKGVILELDRPDQEVKFEWEKSDFDSTFLLELSMDESFETILNSKTTKNNFEKIAIKELGKYFWRIKMINGNATDYSEPVGVEIRKAPMISPPQNLPDLKLKIKYIEKKASFIKQIIHLFISNAYAKTEESFIEWIVPKNEKAKYYLIEIYEDKNMTKRLSQIKSEHNKIEMSPPKSGNFYWRMAYIDYWNRQTEFSPLARFDILEEAVIEKEVPKKTALVASKKITKNTSVLVPSKEAEQKKAELPTLEKSQTNDKKYYLAYNPGKFNYTHTFQTKKIIIDGFIFNAFTLGHRDSYLNEIQFYRGKVFNDLNLLELKYYLGARFLYKNFHIFPILQLGNSSEFLVTNNNVAAKQSFNYGFHLRAYYDLEMFNFIFQLGIGEYIFAFGKIDFKYRNNISFGLFVDKKINSSIDQFFFGPTVQYKW